MGREGEGEGRKERREGKGRTVTPFYLTSGYGPVSANIRSSLLLRRREESF